MPPQSTSSDESVIPSVTVLICTYNRALLLAETLDSMANLHVSAGTTWEVLVVDNRSTDNTADVIRDRQAAYPVPLRYLYEPRQGKSYALNTGLAATRSSFVLFTDDDVRVGEGWIEAAIAPMRADLTVDYTGGPVYPNWEVAPPAWLAENRPELWGAIAILDYGPTPFVFEDHGRIPIGANMAVRRSLFDAVGDFNPDLGRRGDSLLGQEQAEFFCRVRAHGARGVYAPMMSVHHHVPASRLTRHYFRRWWLWKGISRARLHRAHPMSETGVNIQTVRRVAGVPSFTIGELLRHQVRSMWAFLRRDTGSAVEHEMMVAYYAGYAWEEWRRSLRDGPHAADARSQESRREVGDHVRLEPGPEKRREVPQS